MAIKRGDDGSEVLKARLVIGVRKDYWEKSLVHVANNVPHTSVRMLMALASILGFQIWISDIRQAYLQSLSPLLRDEFVKLPPDVIELGPHELLQILKPLYRSSDAGAYWATTLTSFHLHRMQMKQATGDFALFFRHLCDRIVGLSAFFVDDLLEAGDYNYREEMEAAPRSEFDISDSQELPVTNARTKITSNPYTLRNLYILIDYICLI